MPSRSVLTIGNFDGVHAGHRAILARAKEVAQQVSARASNGAGGAGGPPARIIAMAFFPHPATVLRPESAPPLLTEFAERERLLLAAGADQVIRLAPEAQFLAQSPQAFLDQVTARYQPIAFIEGADFRFGRGRAGDLTWLREAGAARGFSVHTVDAADVALSNQHLARASSTLTRWLIEQGRVHDASLVLGRPYRLTGTVVRGDRRGREIGCPTANLRTPCLLPADGVYAGIAHLPDGTSKPAAIHIGPRATFNQPERVVEAHVLGWSGPDLASGEAEYGWPLGLDVCAWLRDQAKFDGIDPLMAQIGRDIARTRELCGA